MIGTVRIISKSCRTGRRERWNAIRKLCTEEFEAAIADLPESRRRGELRDERKFECIKRNGISLHKGLP